MSAANAPPRLRMKTRKIKRWKKNPASAGGPFVAEKKIMKTMKMTRTKTKKRKRRRKFLGDPGGVFGETRLRIEPARF